MSRNDLDVKYQKKQMCHKYALGRLMGESCVRLSVSQHLQPSSQTTGPIKPDSLGCRKVCSNYPGQMTKLAAIYSRNIEIFYRTRMPMTLGLGM